MSCGAQSCLLSSDLPRETSVLDPLVPFGHLVGDVIRNIISSTTHQKSLILSRLLKNWLETYPAHGTNALVHPLVPLAGGHILIFSRQGLAAPVEIW